MGGGGGEGVGWGGLMGVLVCFVLGWVGKGLEYIYIYIFWVSYFGLVWFCRGYEFFMLVIVGWVEIDKCIFIYVFFLYDIS